MANQKNDGDKPSELIPLLKARLRFWKKRLRLLEDFLNQSPCDPDIFEEQYEAWKKYLNHLEKKEPGK